MNEFGSYIKNLRESKGLTLNQVALYSDISAAQLSRIENGKRGVPKANTIKKLSEALKCDFEELMVVAGYIDASDEIIVAGEKVKVTPEEFKVFSELMKHPKAFHDLQRNPEKNIKHLIKMWEVLKEQIKEIEEDDDEYLDE